MSALSLNAKDKRLRIINSKNYLMKLKLKYYMNYTTINMENRYFLSIYYIFRLSWFLPFSSKVKNRCLVTGRSSFVLSYFRMARMTLKNHSSYGWVNGIGKASW